jgi:hypothetical protein
MTIAIKSLHSTSKSLPVIATYACDVLTLGVVLENTHTQRIHHPVSVIFLCPNSMGGVRLSAKTPARLCTSFQHPTHPNCVKTISVASSLTQERSHE